MSFDNTKNHVEINGVPYQITGYQKSEFSPFIGRLGSGDQTESEFDLLKSKTVQGFAGGQLQRYWKDDESVFASEGMYPIYDDGTLYPIEEPTSLAGASSIINTSKARLLAHTKNNQYAFWAYQTFNSPTTYIRKIDTAGTITQLTLPASLNSISVTSMAVWDSNLWITTGIGGKMYYMPLTGSSVTEITGGAAALELLCVWNDQLYGTNANSGSANWVLYRYTGDYSTRAFALLATVGYKTDSPKARLLVYNNRLFLSRVDGLYAYDGIRMVTVDDASSNTNSLNYYLPTVMRGYMYYFMPDGMYRFNGSIIEKLYDISEVGIPKDMVVGKNRLWIIYANSQYSSSSRYDKSLGYDFSSNNSIDGRIVTFNGKGMYTYRRTTTTNVPVSPDLQGQGELDRIFWFNDTIYVTTLYENINGNQSYSISTNELVLSGTKSIVLHTSIYDAEFPMVDKNLENVEVVLDGTVPADDNITIQYRTSGYDTSSGWSTLGVIKTQSAKKIYVFSTLPAGIVWRDIQFRATGSMTAGYGIKKFVMRYMITPDVRWQWRFTALCYGDSPYAPLLLADNTESTQAVRLLRGNLYNARMSDVPIKFIDVDQLDLSGSHSNSVTTINLNSTYLLKDYGFIQIDDEIIYYSAKTSTTLTGCVRAQLGTTAASHADNSKVFPIYRTIIRSLDNERIQLADPTIDTQEDKSRDTEITVLIQEI